MNNLPRRKLLEIIERYGREIVNDPRRCEALMRDYFPANRREIAVLTTALEERIASQLLTVAHNGNGVTPRAVLFARLAERLNHNVAMQEEAARWAVHTWAFALGVITSDELGALELSQAEEAKRVAQPSPALIPVAASPPVNSSQTVVPTAKPKPVGNSVQTRQTIVIAADGSGDFLSISEAVRRASAGARLLVRPGVYDESFEIDKLLEITGDGALESIIVRASNSPCLAMRAGEATVSNLTLHARAQSSTGFFAVDISGGRLLLEACDISSDSLSCIGIHNSSAEPTIRRCRIHHSADSGIYAFDGARAKIEACDIFENANLGIAITGGAQATVANCHVHHGRDAGIVVWDRASSVIDDCDVYANASSGIGISDEAEASVRRSRIHDGLNTGVFVHRSGRGEIEACEIYRHAEAEIAAISGGDVRLRDCQIHSGESSGIIVGDAGRAMLEACEVYENAASGIQVDAGGVGIARGCRINRNGQVAVSCEPNGAVNVENCDLSGNRYAAWRTNHGSHVESRNNRL
jgi:hypothetical protein